MSYFNNIQNFCFSEFSLHQTLPLQEDSPEIEFKLKPLALEPSKNLIAFITSKMKKEDDLTLKEKLEFTGGLFASLGNFTQDLMNEFNEEEYHLTLINWVWRYRKKLKEFRLESGCDYIKFSLNNNQNFENLLPKYKDKLVER